MQARVLHRVLAALTVALLGAGLAGPAASAATQPPIVPGRQAMPAGGTSSTGPGTTYLNTNAQLAETIPAAVKASWRSQHSSCPGSAGNLTRSISVAGPRTVVVERGYQCSYVSAYRTADGTKLWRRAYHFAHHAHVSGARVFVNHDSAAGDTIDALDVVTGTLLWSRSQPADAHARITVGAGLVASGSWLLDERTGAVKVRLSDPLRPSLPSLDGWHGQTLIAGGRVFHNTPDMTYAFTTAGRFLWRKHTPADAPGHGNAQPQYANGTVYLPGPAGSLALDPATGATRRTLPGTSEPLAIDGHIGFFTREPHMEPTVVSAVSLTTGHVYWERALPGSAESLQPMTLWDNAPVVSNGLVWVMGLYDTGTHGRLLALDEVTGAVRTTRVQSCPGSEGQLTIAQGRILTPSTCGVQTFVRQ